MKGKGAYMKQINEKSVKELVSERKKLKKELYNLKMKNAIRGLKETHKI
jgi:ribosomal protein L29